MKGPEKELGSECDQDIEQVVIKMSEIREKMFHDASGNIKQAQVMYKKYYDERRANPEVANLKTTLAMNNFMCT